VPTMIGYKTPPDIISHAKDLRLNGSFSKQLGIPLSTISTYLSGMRSNNKPLGYTYKHELWRMMLIWIDLWRSEMGLHEDCQL
jgi:hypothetical protein